ncbi:hypothetical protein BDR05DRAFT_945399 [Suillus weaverae]|nr:hypothetical protein BDR05DRAFT_945399 [Suillus weaverae]
MGTHKTQYKSAKFIDSSNNDNTIELTSSGSSSSLSEFKDSRSNSGSSTAVDRTLVALLPARDSIDRELDAMEQIPVPSQHKAQNPEPKPRRKRAKKDKALADTVQEPIQKPEAVVLTITYNISLFPAAEMRKDLKKRQGQGTYLKLTADEPFNTFKAQLLVKIDNEMKPATTSFDNYIVSFTIPRLSPSPLSITNQKDHDELIGRVKKAKDLTATVYVQEMQNVRKAPKASDIDESNQPVNKNIRDLHNRWICHKNPGCKSKFCFVNPADGGSHIPLTFPRLECWASAILKGPATATLEKPPNHSHFSMVPEELLGFFILSVH